MARFSIGGGGGNDANRSRPTSVNPPPKRPRFAASTSQSTPSSSKVGGAAAASSSNPVAQNRTAAAVSPIPVTLNRTAPASSSILVSQNRTAAASSIPVTQNRTAAAHSPIRFTQNRTAAASSSISVTQNRTGNATHVQSVPANLETRTQEQRSTDNVSPASSREGSDYDSDSESDSGDANSSAEEPLADPSENSTTPNSNGRRVVELVQPSGNRKPSIEVTVEPDVLDCPICYEPLNPPVYQCENGHIACQLCCIKMKNKCGSCCLPIGYNRCRALEKVIDSALVQCSNSGCPEVSSYSKKFDHEKRCRYIPCSCPFDGCSHSEFYRDLYYHVSIVHSPSYKEIYFDGTFTFSMSRILADRAFSLGNAAMTNVVLLEKNEKIVFALSLGYCASPIGLFGFVVCMAPSSSERVFYYELAAESGNSSLTARTAVENTEVWHKFYMAKQRLIVPGDFISSEPKWKLTIGREKPAARS